MVAPAVLVVQDAAQVQVVEFVEEQLTHAAHRLQIGIVWVDG